MCRWLESQSHRATATGLSRHLGLVDHPVPAGGIAEPSVHPAAEMSAQVSAQVSRQQVTRPPGATVGHVSCIR